ncbi:MAG TPA: glycoside hydrolase family 15 protein [Streptosporangiaceae bacterium]|nr:glycoside hydrolase family 15 protein [Streptosporangiaceae bacterium]
MTQGTPRASHGPARTDSPWPLIEDHALIGDLHTAALVSRAGSVDWLCLPRFDSDAVFTSLLGDASHGHWTISPAGECHSEWSYRPETLVLTTLWHTSSGTARVTDFMPRRIEPIRRKEPTPRTEQAARSERTPHRETEPMLVRIVEGVTGVVELKCAVSLRFGYGRIVPWVRRAGHGIHAVAGPDSVWIDAPVRLEPHGRTHSATFTVSPGERLSFVLTWQPSHFPERPQRIDAHAALEQTLAFWTDWVGSCEYRGEYADAVLRSLITIKALTYAPTGGIVAAPTTSLPEDIGGVRNWDYRYCWLRDATIVLEALLRTGFTQEAAAWRDWLGRTIAGSAADVQIMYGVAGERRLAEWTADWLPGYERSAPVRIGNGAVDQRQLDVYGEVIDAFMLGCQAGLRFDRHTESLIDHLLDFLERHWDEPDEGIWEVRGPRRHFVHSKVMAWVAFDRRLRLAQDGLVDCSDAEMQRWTRARTDIHAQVCERGYNRSLGSFTQYYGGQELDAAVLLIPEVGFLPPDDERVVSTVHAVKRELMKDGLVMRYSAGQPAGQPQAVRPAGADEPVDGLPGSEGAFLACSFWLVNALALIGDHDEARALFDKLLGLRNDLGLLAEEYDPRYDRQVGNFPQAFSHVPLIQAALNLSGHAPQYTRRASAAADA